MGVTDSAAGLLTVTPRAAHLAIVGLSVTAPLMLLATIIFLLRTYLRLKLKHRFELSDWAMAVGFILVLADYALLMPQMSVVRPGQLTLDQSVSINKHGFIATPIWSLAMCFVKCSIAFTLLPLMPADNRIWRWGIFALIAFQISYSVAFSTILLVQCVPLASWWDTSIPGTCPIPFKTIQVVMFVGSVLHTVTDVTTSLLPVFFVLRMRNPLRERICVAFLMGLGLAASASSIVKLTLTEQFRTATDLIALNASVSTYAILEMVFAVVAGNSPYLNPLVQRCLGIQRGGKNSPAPGHWDDEGLYKRAGFGKEKDLIDDESEFGGPSRPGTAATGPRRGSPRQEQISGWY